MVIEENSLKNIKEKAKETVSHVGSEAKK